MPDVTIRLGGRDYVVRPLTLRQLRELGVCLAKARAAPPDPAAAEKLAYDNMVETVAAALSRDNPVVTADVILDLEVTLTELSQANMTILQHSGLVLSPGEAKAEAASIGSTSTVA
jgi:hypothetical protein